MTMGMTTYLYGVIEEYGLNHHRSEEIYLHNERIIAGLPETDSWPPLSKNMFSITKMLRRKLVLITNTMADSSILEVASNRLNMNGLSGKKSPNTYLRTYIGEVPLFISRQNTLK
ncbi:hypothetical protein A3850_011540 [Lewinella sp. 4G2]|nr:hypothetical protein A3850_011540 [Lewinella sp. 4G2]